jgi:two-component system chemotaxis sensor kinase CheA
MIDRKHYHNLIKVMIHIFRNMMDYGIENPEERLLQGKTELGTIACSIETLGEDWVRIVLEDDGSGIDPMLLRARMIEQYPESEDDYSQLTDQDLVQLIFSDGVSTRGEVTMLSGRGIGMSAVREEVEKLGGSVRVQSVIGSGTRFILEVPVLH